MKRILSFILATAIIISLIPVAFAATESEDFTIRYKISEELREEYLADNTSGNKLIEKLTKDETNGFFEFDSVPEGEVLTDNTCIRLRYYGSASNHVTSIQVQKNKSVSFNVYVPVSATYKMKMTHTTYKTVSTDITVTVEDKSFGTYNCLNADNANYAIYAVSDLPQAVYLSEGWHKITFASNNTAGSIGSFSLISGDGTGDALMPYFNGNTTLEIGETATLTGYLSSTAANADVTYTTNNDCVTVGADGTITAVKPGKATVTMTASDSTIVAANPYTVEITVQGVELDNTVQVYIDALSGGTVTKSTDKTIDNVTVGTPVNVEAVADEGYVFSHWKDSEGKFVSSEAEYGFRPYVNTSLIAVFDKTTVEEGDTKTVCFYNGNGEYITEKTTTESSIEMPDDATLTGYIFDMWTVDGVNEFDGMNIINAVTRAVAKYQENGKTYSELKINNTDTVVYDTAKIFNDNSATYWMRNGKIVDYGTTYTHYMWDAATIEAGTGNVEEVPVILIDEHSVENDFYMIEYDLPEGYTKLEAGILFGDDTHKTVDSCYYKAKTANKSETSEHGQFTVKPSSDTTKTWNVVRGYLIYNDGTTNRVIYAD